MSPEVRSTLEQLQSPPVQPLYWQKSPNDPIELGSHQVTFSGKSVNKTDPMSMDASLRFTPSDRLQLAVSEPDQTFVRTLLRDAFSRVDPDVTRLHLRLHSYGTEFDVIQTGNSSNAIVFVPRRQLMQVRKPADSIASAVFHLFNWPQFIGPQDYLLVTETPSHKVETVRSRISLDCDGWLISSTATDQTKASVKALEELGGYAISHVGSIQRADHRPFSTSQLDELLTELAFFFAFVFGRWSSPCLTVGIDAAGKRVFEEWGMRTCDSGSWPGGASWFDARHSEMLVAVLPGFHKLWSSQLWSRPLRDAIHWYLLGNRGAAGLSVDSALLFSQAALELLAWTHCVSDRKMVSENAFKPRGLSASDKLRLLASSLGIPLEIPPSLSSLHARPGKKWDDAMDAITDLRNGLVHPGNNATVPDGVYYGGWRLSMWYLDLILLRLCEYSGNYANRLRQRFVGETEPVPWVR